MQEKNYFLLLVAIVMVSVGVVAVVLDILRTKAYTDSLKASEKHLHDSILVMRTPKNHQGNNQKGKE